MLGVTPNLLNLSTRFYRLLLNAYPARFRSEYGPHMAQLFRDDARDTLHNRGHAALAGLWLLVLLDLLKTAINEHIREIFNMPSKQLLRWGGIAAALGGALWASGLVVIFTLNGPIPPLNRVLPFGVAVPLMAFGLVSFYRRLPPDLRTVNVLGLSVALLGLLAQNAGMITLFLTPINEDLTAGAAIFGFFVMLLGIATLGAIAFARKVLGAWSWVPLLLPTISGLLFIYSATHPDDSFSSFTRIFVILYGFGWVALGMALWMTHDESPDTGQMA